MSLQNEHKETQLRERGRESEREREREREREKERDRQKHIIVVVRTLTDSPHSLKLGHLRKETESGCRSLIFRLACGVRGERRAVAFGFPLGFRGFRV